MGALANEVRASMIGYLDDLERDGSLWSTWMARQDEVRRRLAQVFRTDPTQVAVTPSASAAVSSIASAVLTDPKRPKVVTTELEFPTVGQIWHARERQGAEVVHVPTTADLAIDMKALEAAIDDRTAIVSVTHVCYRNGAMTDLAPVIDLAHARGALVLVDAYQSVGAVPIDFPALGADFLVGGVLKYMLGLPGVGFALASPKTAQYVPSITGWFAARDIFAMDIHAYDPARDARRFEGGTPVVPCLYPAAAGLGLLLEVGLERAWEHSKRLHQQLRDTVQELGGTVVTPADRHGPMLAVAATDDHALVAALEADRVITSCRDGNLRISPHFYNNAQDIEVLGKALQRHRHLLR
ncbi:MAG: aminotransferase class V-fold PLP-dependent enzyme [Actinomycetales bacterium]